MTPEALASLHSRCFTPRAWTPAEFADLLVQPTTLLATLPEGFVLGRIAGPEAELLTIAVAPEWRRRGYGTALVAAVEAQACRRGALEAFLEVSETNSAALALYSRHGWLPVGRRPGYYCRRFAPPGAAIVLRKVLTEPSGNP